METTTHKERELELENIRLKEELKRALELIVSEVFGCGFTDKDWNYVKKGDCQLHYRITVERIEE